MKNILKLFSFIIIFFSFHAVLIYATDGTGNVVVNVTKTQVTGIQISGNAWVGQTLSATALFPSVATVNYQWQYQDCLDL